jgi:hypothetical protein
LPHRFAQHLPGLSVTWRSMIGFDRCEPLAASIAIPYRLSLAKVRERFVEVPKPTWI